MSAERAPRRLSLWLLVAWCVIALAWIVAGRLPLSFCPNGQAGCAQEPIHTAAETLWYTVVAVAGALVLLALWWWERRQAAPRPVSTPPRRFRWRWMVAASVVGVAFCAHLLLFAPMDPNPFCVTPVHLNSAMAYPLNCDSPLFMRLAHHPGQVLDFHNMRQSRPGYVAVSALLTHTVGPVIDAAGLNELYGQSDSAYLPLVGFDLLVAAAALALLIWLLGRLGAPPAIIVAPAVLLVINDVTKAFAWTPHQQTFALLVPMISIVVGRWLLLARPSWAATALLGLGIGVASTFYGSFLITLGVAVLALLAWRWRGLLLAAITAAAAALPQLTWIAICRAVAGEYYNHEAVVYHEFTWLTEFPAYGGRFFARALVTMSTVTVRELVDMCGIVLLVISVLAAVAVRSKVRLTPETSEQRAILYASALTVAVSFGFAWAIGLFAERLMFHAVPGLLLVVGWLAARLSASSPLAARVTAGALFAVALASTVVELTKHGPYG